MQIEEQVLAATYRRYSDDEVAALAAQMEELTDAARAALGAEIQRRGMSRAQLERLHSREAHREARFDQLEAVRRKKTVLYLMTRNDPKGWIVAVLIVLGLGLLAWLRSLFH